MSSVVSAIHGAAEEKVCVRDLPFPVACSSALP